MTAPIPFRDAERVSILKQYEILDTNPEDRFDRIVEEAAELCDVPIAMFTLVDESRQWFKSRVGIDLSETPRAVSLCAYVVANDAPLVIEDTLKLDVVATNPLVTGFPNIRFYAGFPVRAHSGDTLGALCVIDREPRKFTWKHFRLLQELAGKIQWQLEIRRLAFSDMQLN